jgi:hypothetical protein
MTTKATKKEASKKAKGKGTNDGQKRRLQPGEPIVIGGGPGRRKRITADYVTIDFDESKYTNGSPRPGYRLATLEVLDRNDDLLADLTKFLPDDRDCKVDLNCVGFYTITIKGKPISITFDANKFEKESRNSTKHTGQTKVRSVEIDLKAGDWSSLKLGEPKQGRKYKIQVESEPIPPRRRTRRS